MARDDEQNPDTSAPTRPGPSDIVSKDTTAAPMTPTRLGPYRVEGLLGAGGMGEVYAGYDERLLRTVALKRIGALQRRSYEANARFTREARALAALRHPGVVTVYETGETEEGDLYIAMELVSGRPLADLLADPWPVALALHVCEQVADALGAAHAAGILHRDVKPANLLVEQSGQIRVVDFGLAGRTDGNQEQLTRTGVGVGTPAYMSPEQVNGEPTGPETDVFAVGTLLYRMLAGAHPFARNSALATALAIASGGREPLSRHRPNLPPVVLEVVDRCLTLAASDRIADGRALAGALKQAALRAGLVADRVDLARWLSDRIGGAAPDGPALAPTITPSEASPALHEAGAPIVPGPPQPHHAASFSSELAATRRPSIEPEAPSTTQPAARLSRRRARRWWAVMIASTLLAAGLGLWLFEGSGSKHQAAPTTTPVTPKGVGAALPPRPAVAVLGFRGVPSTTQIQRDAAVLADALRMFLDLDPERVSALQRPVLRAMVPPGSAIGPQIDIAHLVRPHRRAGHVDVVVRGTLERNSQDQPATDRLEIELVETRRGRLIGNLEVTGSADQPVALALQAANAILPELGGRPPARPPTLDTVTDCWWAYLGVVDAQRAGDQGAAMANLQWALRLDPTFPPARLAELSELRAQRRTDELARRGRELLEVPRLLPRQRVMANAWVSLALGRTPEAIRRLHDLIERWPYDLEAHHLLLAIRFHDPRHLDLAESERLARRLLTIAPRDPTTASRLVRALAWRGRAAETETLLYDLGVPLEDPDFTDVWGEIDLYQNRFDAARLRFQAASRRAQANLYAEHMALAAQILGDQCGDAAVAALARIERIETLGRDANLDWTYSLAVQALVCQTQWSAAHRLLDRWAGRSPSGAEQALTYRIAIDVSAGARRDTIARRVEARLADGGTPPQVTPRLLMFVARFSEDPDALTDHMSHAERAAIDLDRPASIRAEFDRARRALSARRALVEGHFTKALAAYDAMVFPWADVRAEGDLSGRVEAMALRAEALEAAGEPIRALSAWAEIAALGYPRLWRTDLWVTARARLRDRQGR